MTRAWLAAGVLSLSVLLIGVDGTVLALAIPFISKDLDPTATQMLWIGDIYSFVLAGLLVTMGSLGDRIGGCPATRASPRTVMRRVNPRTQTPIAATILPVVVGFLLMAVLPGDALLELLTVGGEIGA